MADEYTADQEARMDELAAEIGDDMREERDWARQFPDIEVPDLEWRVKSWARP